MPEKWSAPGEFHTAQSAAKVAVIPEAQQHPFEKKCPREERRLLLAPQYTGAKAISPGPTSDCYRLKPGKDVAHKPMPGNDLPQI